MPKLWTQVRRRTNFVAATGLAFALGLSGCTADSSTPDPADDRPVVLTTFTVLADLAQNVAGEHLRVESITKVGSEIHGYEPTPGDLRTAASADLILDNGLGLEAWFAQFIDQLALQRVALRLARDDGRHPDDARPAARRSERRRRVQAQSFGRAAARSRRARCATDLLSAWGVHLQLHNRTPR